MASSNENTIKAWEFSAEDFLALMSSDAERGLPLQKVHENQKRYGPNSIQQDPGNPWLIILLRQFRNPIIMVLLLGFGISLSQKEVLDAIAILIIVLMNILIGFFQEFKAEKSLKALARYAAPSGRVIREGKVHVIPFSDATPGDLLILESGDFVIADARIIEVQQLRIDESLLTGESLPVKKLPEAIVHGHSISDRTNMIFGGTVVASGTAKAIVSAVGSQTEMGKIARMLESPISTETPLQKKLEILSRKLLFLGLLIILVIFFFGFYQGKEMREIILLAVSLSIAVLPESLPTVVTVALLAAIMRLSRKNVLMRRMDAIETLGEVDIICTDKTGTLTTGKMEVVDFRPVSENFRDLLIQNMVSCNNASINNGGSGDPTEIALLAYASRLGKDLDQLRRTQPRLKEWSFESDRKRMSVITGNETPWVFVKGAPESLLPRCRLDPEVLTHFLEEAKILSGQGMRTLAFAGKASEEKFLDSQEQAEDDLTFYGLVAIADPIREDVHHAIGQCHAAGIRVIMMTGDHPQTAKYIAQKLGIFGKDDDKVLSGNDWEKYSPDELKTAFAEINVFARVSPEHKLALVRSLKEAGYTIAMTGDGVNDGPALKESSVGISMGKGGTEVARQASSLVITDDNFSSIVSAVSEGRAVLGNIKRSIHFLLSQNLAELLFIGISMFFNWPMPFNPLALLWINVVTDGVPALALAAGKIPDNFLATTSGREWKNIFDRKFQLEMYSVGILLTSLTVGVYLAGLYLEGDALSARSYAFSFLIFAILFHSLSCMSEKLTFFEMKPNIPLLLSILLPICLQIMMQNSVYFLKIFNVRALNWQELLVLFALSPIPVLLVELSKVLRRKKTTVSASHS